MPENSSYTPLPGDVGIKTNKQQPRGIIFTMIISRKTLALANKEVETFLCILGEEDVQRELDGAVSFYLIYCFY